MSHYKKNYPNLYFYFISLIQDKYSLFDLEVDNDTKVKIIKIFLSDEDDVRLDNCYPLRFSQIKNFINCLMSEGSHIDDLPIFLYDKIISVVHSVWFEAYEEFNRIEEIDKRSEINLDDNVRWEGLVYVPSA